MPRNRFIPLMLGVVLFGMALAVAGALWHSGAAPAPQRSRVMLHLGSARLLVPANLIRLPERRIDGSVNAIDLAMRWPGFEPLEARAAVPDAKPDAAIFIRIELADTTIDPAQRPRELYARFLASEVASGPGTLIRRAFKPGSPYAGEYLEIAPPEGETFAARCLAAATVESDAARCLWLFRDRDLDIQVRFSPEILPNWERLNDHVRQFVQRMRVDTP